MYSLVWCSTSGACGSCCRHVPPNFQLSVLSVGVKESTLFRQFLFRYQVQQGGIICRGPMGPPIIVGRTRLPTNERCMREQTNELPSLSVVVVSHHALKLHEVNVIEVFVVVAGLQLNKVILRLPKKMYTTTQSNACLQYIPGTWQLYCGTKLLIVCVYMSRDRASYHETTG